MSARRRRRVTHLRVRQRALHCSHGAPGSGKLSVRGVSAAGVDSEAAGKTRDTPEHPLAAAAVVGERVEEAHGVLVWRHVSHTTPCRQRWSAKRVQQCLCTTCLAHAVEQECRADQVEHCPYGHEHQQPWPVNQLVQHLERGKDGRSAAQGGWPASVRHGGVGRTGARMRVGVNTCIGRHDGGRTGVSCHVTGAARCPSAC